MNPAIAQFYHKNILVEACQRYELDPAETRLLRANSNIVFDCGDKILRLTHSTIRPIHEIELELAWLLDLNHRQLPVTQIVASSQGLFIEKIGDKNHFSVVCFEKVIGEAATNEDWTPSLFTRLGTITAQLHLAGAAYLEKTQLVYPNWDEIPEHHCSDFLVTDRFDFRPLYHDLTKQLEDRPPSSMGILHYDIHFGNFLLTGIEKDIILFDFEMCCHGRLVDDIATVLYYASRHPAAKEISDFESVFFQAFKSGYEQLLPIDQNALEYLTHYLLYRDLMVLGFIKKAWGDEPWEAKQTEYQEMLFTDIERRREELKM